MSLLWKIRPQQLQHLLWGPLKVYSLFLFIVGLCKNVMNLKHLMGHKQEVYFVNVLKKKRIYTSSKVLKFCLWLLSDPAVARVPPRVLLWESSWNSELPNLDFGVWLLKTQKFFVPAAGPLTALLRVSADLILLRTVCVCSEEPAGASSWLNTSTFDLSEGQTLTTG